MGTIEGRYDGRTVGSIDVGSTEGYGVGKIVGCEGCDEGDVDGFEVEPGGSEGFVVGFFVGFGDGSKVGIIGVGRGVGSGVLIPSKL